MTLTAPAGPSARTAPSAGNASGPDVSTPAVLLKFDPNVMHHGALGAIRSLGRMGVEVYAVQETAWAPAASSRYLRAKVVWRPGGLPADQVQAGLTRLSDRIGRPAVLIPTDDAGAIFLAEHGAPLRDRFLFADPPPALPRQVAGKYSLHELCTTLGVPAPRTILPATAAQAAQFAAASGYPLVAKLARPWESAGQQRSTVIIGDRAGLDAAWQAAQHGAAGLMLQEFIPSTPGGDWFFHAYSGADAVCRPACTGIKDRSYPAHAGLTSCGRWAPNSALRADMMGLLAQLGYRGIADLDLRLDRRDGQYKLLDFNPRVGAQFRLFTDAGGLDVVRAAYLDLTGQQVPAGPATAGRTFVAENYDPLSAISYWRRGELRPGAWLASVRDADEAAWFARDDLLPFGLMCVRMGWRMLTRMLTRPLASGRRRAGPASQPELRVSRGRSPIAGAAAGSARRQH
jgi:D-aspartate ligase